MYDMFNAGQVMPVAPLSRVDISALWSRVLLAANRSLN